MKHILCIVFVISLLSCKNEESQPFGGAEYSPIETGNFWIYDVKYEGYSITEKPVFLNYQLKEKIGFEIGTNTYTIEVARRDKPTDTWKSFGSNWIEVRPDQQLVSDGNQVIIQIQYPLTENATWWSNDFENSTKSVIKVKDFGSEYTVLGKNFPESVTIYQKNDSSLVETNRDFSVFAKNVGLVYKEKTAIAYCQNQDCIGKGKPDNGYRIKQSLISYGKE